LAAFSNVEPVGGHVLTGAVQADAVEFEFPETIAQSPEDEIRRVAVRAEMSQDHAAEIGVSDVLNQLGALHVGRSVWKTFRLAAARVRAGER
jgi:hypothetical protein